jgi:O-antigen/teichoic acid export membrane protein
VVAAIVAAVAMPVSSFFAQPLLVPMLWVMAGTILVAGLLNVRVIRFKRDLEFKKQFVYEASGMLADVIVSVALALVLRSAWALLAGGLARQLGLLCAGYLLSPYRPRLRFRVHRFRRLFRFGRWMLVENMAEVLMTQADSVLVGRWFGPAALGLYQMSYRIANVPKYEISGIAVQVAFPAYAKLQDDLAQARAAFFDTLRVLSLVAFPSAIGIGLVAPEFVRLVLGLAWLEAIPLLQILAVYGALAAIEFKKPLVLAFGRPDLDAKVDLLRLGTLLVMAVPLALTWGLAGVSVAVVLSVIVGLTTSLIVCARLLGFGLGRYVGIFLAPALGGAALLAGGMLVRSLAAPHGDLAAFICTVVAGVLSYGTAVILVDRYTGGLHRAICVRLWQACFRSMAPLATGA